MSLTLKETLAKYHDGPTEGVFTDGACSGNPGPGGWGVVYVRENAVVEQRYGKDPDTTNNRMELMAIIEGLKMLPVGIAVTMWSDSNLCVRSLTEWAAGWQARGWKRKTGPIANLELVKEAYAALNARPGVELKWIKAHSGNRWNEYADSLSTAFERHEL